MGPAGTTDRRPERLLQRAVQPWLNYSKHVRINKSMVNAFDKKPPIVGSTIGSTIGSTGTNSGNTFPQYDDAIGRYLTLGASLKF